MAAEGERAARERGPSLDLAQGLAASARNFDTMVHERTRLAILSSLSAAQSMSFRELKSLLGVTDGNLSVHARRLEDAGYLAVRKGFRGRQPRTTFSLTPAGRQALEAYLRHMEALISAIGRLGSDLPGSPGSGPEDESARYPLPTSALGGA